MSQRVLKVTLRFTGEGIPRINAAAAKLGKKRKDVEGYLQEVADRIVRLSDDYLTPREVAYCMNISIGMVRKLIHKGAFRGEIKLNPRVTMVPRSDVEKYLRSQERFVDETWGGPPRYYGYLYSNMPEFVRRRGLG